MNIFERGFRRVSEALSELDPFKDGSLVSNILEGLDPTNPNRGIGQAIDWLNPVPQKEGQGLDLRQTGDWVREQFSLPENQGGGDVDPQAQALADELGAMRQWRENVALPMLDRWRVQANLAFQSPYTQRAYARARGLLDQLASGGVPEYTTLSQQIAQGQYQWDPYQVRPAPVAAEQVSSEIPAWLTSIVNQPPALVQMRAAQGVLDPTDTLRALETTGLRTSLLNAIQEAGAGDALSRALSGNVGSITDALNAPDYNVLRRIQGETPTDFAAVAEAFGGPTVGAATQRILGQRVAPLDAQLQALGPANPTSTLAEILSTPPGQNPWLKGELQSYLSDALQKWRDVRSNLLDQILPQVRRQAQGRGQIGSTRQAIVEAKTLENADRILRDLLENALGQGSRVLSGAYRADQALRAQTGTELARTGAGLLSQLLGTQSQLASSLVGSGVQEALGRRTAATSLTGRVLGEEAANQRLGFTTAANIGTGLTQLASNLAEAAAGRKAATAAALNEQAGRILPDLWRTQATLGASLWGQQLGVEQANAARALQAAVESGRQQLQWGDLARQAMQQNLQTAMAGARLGALNTGMQLSGALSGVQMGLLPAEYNWGTTQRFIGAGSNLFAASPKILQPPASPFGLGPQTAGLLTGLTIGGSIGGLPGVMIGAPLGWLAGTVLG